MDIFSCCEINTSQFVGHFLAVINQQANAIKNRVGKLVSMTWFLRFVATGFDQLPSAPKAFNSSSAALGFQAMTIFFA